MSQLSHQELAEFFDLFATLSTKNSERLSSLPISAPASRTQDPVSFFAPEDNAKGRISTAPSQKESQDRDTDLLSPAEAAGVEDVPGPPADTRVDSTTPTSNIRPLRDIWVEYLKFVPDDSSMRYQSILNKAPAKRRVYTGGLSSQRAR